MGNCLVLQERAGEVLQHKATMSIRQVISGFSGPSAEVAADKRRVRFGGTEENGEGSGVMRIKLVVSKKDLEEMLKGGRISYHDLVSSHFQKELCRKQDNNSGLDDDDCNISRIGWKPILESIPE